MSDLISIFERIPTTDWITTFAALIIIFILLFIIELGSRKFGLKKSHSRKAVHIIVGLLICLAAYVLTSNIPILILAFLFVLFDWWAIRTQHFTSIHPHSQSLGTVFYPLAVFLLALLLWYENKHIFIIATLIMVIPDALAAIVGETYSRQYIVLLREKKSLLGASTMFISTQLLVFIAIYFFLHKTMLDSLLISIMIALLATASELLSVRGSDNLSVPLISAFFLHAYLNISATEQLTIGILLSTILGILSYRFKFLKIDGAIMAFILGSIIFGFGGISYAIPILAFFIFSSLLSAAGKNKKKLYESLYAKTGERDLYQVIANGGIAGIIVIFMYLFKLEKLYPVYLVAVAAATADTWATELGVFSWSEPRLITNLKKVKAGTSGAVSPLGTLAALVGSSIIAIIGYLISPENMGFRVKGKIILIIVLISGFCGSFIDSLIGATVQGQYNCEICSNLTEKKLHCGYATHLIKGFSWITNDFVNIISIAVATLFSFYLLKIWD